MAFLDAAWALYARSLLGFPDGFRGPADRLLEPVLVSIAAIVVLVGVVSLFLSKRRSVLVASAAVVLLIAATMSVGPVLRHLYPSTGG